MSRLESIVDDKPKKLRITFLEQNEVYERVSTFHRDK